MIIVLGLRDDSLSLLLMLESLSDEYVRTE